MALQKLVENYARDWNENTLSLKKIPLQENKTEILIENKEKKIFEGYIIPIWKLDVENLNGRIYSKKLGEKIVKENQTTLMLADHPDDDGSVSNIVAVAKNPFIKDNVLYSECYIVDKEFKEKIDKIVQLKCGVGISSSGLGELNEDGSVNIDSYILERFGDFVTAPSFAIYLDDKAEQTITENKDNEMTESVGDKEEGLNEESLPPALKKAQQLQSDKILDWEKVNNSYVVSFKKQSNLTAIVDSEGKQIHDVDTWEDAKSWITRNIKESTQPSGDELEESKEEEIIDILKKSDKIPEEMRVIKANNLFLVQTYSEKQKKWITQKEWKKKEDAIKDMKNWYKESTQQSEENVTISNIEEKEKKEIKNIKLDELMKDMKNLTLEQKNFRISMSSFIKEANNILEIEEKIARFKEMLEWCGDSEEKNQAANKPIQTIIEQKLKDLSKDYDSLAMKGKQTDNLVEKVTGLETTVEEKEKTYTKLNDKTEDLYEKFDEVKEYTNKIQEMYDKAVIKIKSYKKKFIESSKLDETIYYIEKLELEIKALRKMNEDNNKELEKYQLKIKETSDKEIKDNAEFEKMLTESQKRVQDEKVQTRLEEIKQENTNKEKSASFDCFRQDVLDLYESWKKETPKIEQFRTEILECRNIREAQSKYLKLKDYLYDDYRPTYNNVPNIDEDRSALYEPNSVVKQNLADNDGDFELPKGWN